MAHDHAHGHVDRRRLTIALVIVGAVVVVQVVGALLSGSLALLADAGHVVGDGIGLAVALAAGIVGARPATDRHTYGFRRVEVLGALVNGVLLTVVAVIVAIEGVRRLIEAENVDVAPLPMGVVAAIGLVANVVAFLVLRGSDRASLNMRGARLEVLGDLFGSVAALVAALVIQVSGFVAADAIASLLIAALIVPRAALLLRDVTRVLTESVPHDTDVAAIRRHILETPGVVALHDVHVWAMTSGDSLFSAHVECDPRVFADGDTGVMLERLRECLRGHFDVEHSTFQLEPAGHADREDAVHR